MLTEIDLLYTGEYSVPNSSQPSMIFMIFCALSAPTIYDVTPSIDQQRGVQAGDKAKIPCQREDPAHISDRSGCVHQVNWENLFGSAR